MTLGNFLLGFWIIQPLVFLGFMLARDRLPKEPVMDRFLKEETTDVAPDGSLLSEWDECQFDPLDDITAYELAVMAMTFDLSSIAYAGLREQSFYFRRDGRFLNPDDPWIAEFIRLNCRRHFE